MAATYTSKERCNNERPVADLGTLPTEQGHRMPDGTVHPIQIGLRMGEEFRTSRRTPSEQLLKSTKKNSPGSKNNLDSRYF